MGSRTTDHTLPSVEWVGADLKKRTGVRIEESFFPMLSACLREVLGQKARGGASEGYTESAKNLERGVRADPRRQGSMEVSSIEGLLACLGGIKCRRPPSMPGTSPLLLEKRWCTQQIRGGDWFSQSGVGSIFG